MSFADLVDWFLRNTFTVWKESEKYTFVSYRCRDSHRNSKFKKNFKNFNFHKRIKKEKNIYFEIRKLN